MVQTSGEGDISQRVCGGLWVIDFPAAPNNIYLRTTEHMEKVDILVRLQCLKRKLLYQAERDFIANRMLMKPLRGLEEQKSGGCPTVGLEVRPPLL